MSHFTWPERANPLPLRSTNALAFRVLYRSLLFSLLSAGCAAAPKPCAGPLGCGSGRECLAFRCVQEGGSPVPANASRLLLSPVSLALASRNPVSGLPGTFTLGSEKSSIALYVRFDQSFRGRPVAAAFLLLDSRPSTAGSRDIELEVWRAERDWSGQALKWSQQPGFAPPYARGIGRNTPALPVRIDVTEIVRFLANHPESDHGLVVRAASTDGPGIALSTGVNGGSAPKLDVYLRR